MAPRFTPPRPLLGALEAAANQALQLDPDIAPRLERLEGKVLKLHIEGLRLDIYSLVSAGNIVFFDSFGSEADVKLSAPPLALMRMALSGANNPDVHFSGDSHVAQQFQQLLQSLDIDWEELLSRYIGDIGARQIGLLANRFNHWLKRSDSSLNLAARDYLQEEVQHTPSQIEVDNFSDDIDQLCMDTDRLAARIKRLEQRNAAPRTDD